MKRLRFDRPASHVLVEAGERIIGGSEFVTTDDRAVELLADPHVDVVELLDPVSLERLTRAALDRLARERGVSGPERFSNKAAVIAAIAAPEAIAGEGLHHHDPEEDS